MRVLLVSHRYPPDGRSGVERCAQMLAAELAAIGDTVGVFTRLPTLPQRQPFLQRDQEANGTPVYRVVGGDAGLDTFLDYHRPIEQYFEVALVETAPEVVHFHHVKDLSPRLIELAHRQGAAVVLTLHDFYFACALVHLRKLSGGSCDGPDGGRECARTCFAREGVAALPRWGARTVYFRRLLAAAERVICPSAYLADYFAGFGVRPERLKRIPNGLRLDALAPLTAVNGRAREPGQLNLAFLGSVVDYKGVHIILEALRLARLPAVALAVLGQVMNRDYAQRLRRQAAGIPGLDFRLYGAYEPDEIPYLLNGVDCVVIPSLVPESFSLTTREALAHGIPVVAARLGALPEAVTDGQNGFTYTADRPAELAVILQRLAEEDDLLPRLRQGARASYVLTAPEHCRAVRAVYHEAVAEYARTPSARWGDEQERGTLYDLLVQLNFSAR
jgi:glycosyltransferase involved in cell wall biosynthesis